MNPPFLSDDDFIEAASSYALSEVSDSYDFAGLPAEDRLEWEDFTKDVAATALDTLIENMVGSNDALHRTIFQLLRIAYERQENAEMFDRGVEHMIINIPEMINTCALMNCAKSGDRGIVILGRMPKHKRGIPAAIRTLGVVLTETRASYLSNSASRELLAAIPGIEVLSEAS